MSDETAAAPVWSEEDDRRSEASYAALLTRTLGLWLHGAIAALLIPLIGLFGPILFGGIVVLAIAIPARAIWWHRRFGSLAPLHPEMVKARGHVRMAVVLWLLGPVTYTFVTLLGELFYGRLRLR